MNVRVVNNQTSKRQSGIEVYWATITLSCVEARASLYTWTLVQGDEYRREVMFNDETRVYISTTSSATEAVER